MEFLNQQLKQILGTNPRYSLTRVVRLPLGTGDAVGDLLSWQNKTGRDVLAFLLLDITTESSAVETADIGVDDGGDVSNDTLFDGLALDGTARLYNSLKDGGTNGIGFVIVPSTHYIVGTNSGEATALEGNAYIVYITLQP